MNRNKHMHMNNVNVRSGFEWKNIFYTVRFIYNLHAEKLTSLVANANSASYVSGATMGRPGVGLCPPT